MTWLRQTLAGGGPSRPVLIKGSMPRHPKRRSTHHLAQSSKRRAYLRAACDAMGLAFENLDIDAALTTDFGLSALDVGECVAIAESHWGVSLMRQKLRRSDIQPMLQRYVSFRAIMAEAEKRAFGATLNGRTLAVV